MKRTLPVQAVTQHRFECPYCEWPVWFSDKQLEHPRFMWVCIYCYKAFKPALTLVEEKLPKVEKDELAKTIESILVAQGYSRSEAIERVSKTYDASKPLEQLVVEAFRVRLAS